MTHVEFESKVMEIYDLIQNSSKPEEIADFIDKSVGLKEYLASNEDWSHLDFSSSSPLFAAASTGRAEILALLLAKYGMPINARCEMGRIFSGNALTWAVVQNHAACVRMLLQHGADRERPGSVNDKYFQNALELDRLCKSGEIVRCVSNRDDTIKKLLEEEALRQSGEGANSV